MNIEYSVFNIHLRICLQLNRLSYKSLIITLKLFNNSKRRRELEKIVQVEPKLSKPYHWETHADRLGIRSTFMHVFMDLEIYLRINAGIYFNENKKTSSGSGGT